MHDAYVMSTEYVMPVTHALRQNINSCSTQRHGYEYEHDLKNETKNNKISRTTSVLVRNFIPSANWFRRIGTIIAISTNATLLRGKGWLIRI